MRGKQHRLQLRLLMSNKHVRQLNRQESVSPQVYHEFIVTGSHPVLIWIRPLTGDPVEPDLEDRL